MRFVKIVNAVGEGFRLYINLIFVGAALYAMYLLAVDLITGPVPPNRPAVSDSAATP